MKFVYAMVFILALASVPPETSAQRSACVCPAVYSPVCGTDGQTYSNSCHLKCAGARLKHSGSC